MKTPVPICTIKGDHALEFPTGDKAVEAREFTKEMIKATFENCQFDFEQLNQSSY